MTDLTIFAARRGRVWSASVPRRKRASEEYFRYYGDGFKVECPTGSGQYLTLIAKTHFER